jgi:hypothetical protein
MAQRIAGKASTSGEKQLKIAGTARGVSRPTSQPQMSFLSDEDQYTFSFDFDFSASSLAEASR